MTTIDTEDLKAPPHSLESEQSVIGALLTDNRAYDVIGDKLRPEHFFRADHQALYRCIERLITADRGVDPTTLFEALQHAGKAQEAGGLPYIMDLALNTPGAANIARYAEIVIDRAKLRGVIAVARELIDDASSPRGKPAADVLDSASEKLEKLAETGDADAGPVLIRDQLAGVIDQLDQQYHGSVAAAEPTGFIDLDAKLNGGLRAGELVIIAGRPAMAKTTLAMAIADRFAQRRPVAVFSLEMPSEQLHKRGIAREGGIPLPRVMDGKKMHDEDWPRLTHAVQVLSERQLWVDDQPALTLLQIRNRSRKVKRMAGDLGLIVVDYIGLMEGGERTDNRTQRIGSYSRGLKELAKQLGVPVIALSQLSRKVEERPNKRPLVSDLRDSGEIEQDADIILMLYRDEIYNPDTMDKGIAEVIIGKQRNGETGRVALCFAGEYSRFSDMAPGASYGRQVNASRQPKGFDE
jgi:replicative DNA helicase